ncbi:EAL domain-containing protein [Erwinia sp. V71]|uniref:EAL domain-containing protein n=1 Tax=Erwinia sp. V71 TaxID=3369424 RepID=UPI003F5E0FFF
MLASIRKRRERSWQLLLAAGLLPLMLCLVFTYFAAQQLEKRQQIGTAQAVLSQAERISDLAWGMVDYLQTYDHLACDSVSSEIQRVGSTAAYFRSVGLTAGNTVLCSSAYGLNPGTVSVMIRDPKALPLPPQMNKSISGSSGVPGRPAVIFFRQKPSGEGAFAMVDGQYLIDFMHALGQPRDYQVSLQFDHGYIIKTGRAQRDQHWLFSTPVYHISSTRYPIDISVATPVSEALSTWRQVFLTFLPMAAILSLVLMALASNWLRRKMSYQDEIRRGIRNHEFSVNYQPVYDAERSRCAGAEALLRWQRPDGEWVRPDMFIAAAEAEGMIIPLTQHLLELIAEDVDHWPVPPNFHLGINVAAEHLQHPCFVEDIRRFAARLAHKPLVIILELTERSLISEGEEVAAKLATLRREGIEIAIDDFGTGNCSLSYLQTFQLDYLKIDRGFINAIECLEGETPVLDAIINLSHKLNLQILGEGVETPLQYQYLKNHGVAFIQGFLYARPMSNEALIHWLLQENRPLPGIVTP